MSKTAKPVALYRHLTAKRYFWDEVRKKQGTRDRDLIKGDHALIFFPPEQVSYEPLKERADLDKLQLISVRAKAINKMYQAFIKKQDYKQVLILGSGYDTRAIKKNPTNQMGKKNAEKYAQVKFFEVEKAVILDDKKRILDEAKIDQSNSVYVRADYTEPGFIEKLKSAGINFQTPTVVIWEGNIMYLEKEQLNSVMKTLKAAFPQLVIAFDYFGQTFLDKQKNGIWKTGIDDIQAFANEHGLQLLENNTTAKLSKYYEVDNSPSDAGEQYFVGALSSTPTPKPF